MNLVINEIEKLNTAELESAVRAYKHALIEKQPFKSTRLIFNDNDDYKHLACSFEVKRTGKNVIVRKVG
jgi:transposase